MKKLLLGLTLIMATNYTSFAQLKVKVRELPKTIHKVKNFGVQRFEISRLVVDTDTTYYINYVNNGLSSKYTVDRETFYITATVEEMLQLEHVMLTTLTEGSKDNQVTITFGGNKDYILYPVSTLGVRELWVWYNEYNYFRISRKEIVKLFSIFHKN